MIDANVIGRIAPMVPDVNSQRLVRVFNEILEGHAARLGGYASLNAHAGRSSPLNDSLPPEIIPRLSRSPIANTQQVGRFSALIEDFQRQIEHWRKAQESTAYEFDLFAVLNVADDEVRHSRLLEWLLDWRIEAHGTHAQGNRGFRLFLEEVELPTSYAEGTYWVRRELAGADSRVDIEIAAREKFLIHIENKLHSSEGADQTIREGADLLKRAKELGIPRITTHGFYLTLDGSAAANPQFKTLSWRSVAQVFDRFASTAHPPEVKLFAAHCARILRRSTAGASIHERNENYGKEPIQ